MGEESGDHVFLFAYSPLFSNPSVGYMEKNVLEDVRWEQGTSDVSSDQGSYILSTPNELSNGSFEEMKEAESASSYHPSYPSSPVAVDQSLMCEGGLESCFLNVMMYHMDEAVAQQFIEAMNDQDVDKMAALCPPFLDPGQEDIEDMLDSYSGYDVTFKYEGVESKEMYDSDDLDDLEEDISDYADKTIKLQDACDLEFSFNVAVTMSGETYDQSSTYPITCIKYKGNWYLYE